MTLDPAPPDTLTPFLGQPPDDLTGKRTYFEVLEGWPTYAIVYSSFLNYNLLLWSGAWRPGLTDKLPTFYAVLPDAA